MSDKIQVAIKVRPLVAREEGGGEFWRVRENALQLLNNDKRPTGEVFTFDHVFGNNTTNMEVFEKVVKPLVDRAVKGFNATIFAYGQTSSGKTHTMLGDGSEAGITQLAVSAMFDFMKKSEGREFLVRVSYMEIYNEKVNDLLEQQNINLKVGEEDGKVVVYRLKEEFVADTGKVMSLLKKGQKIRRIGETNLNERSSRSHTIFRLIIESRESDKGDDGIIQVSQLNLVDLAGSERAGMAGTSGERLKEGCAINRSLFQLSQVVSKLSEGSEFVNFRDSKLTRILQSSLGGNAHTLIICTVTPASVEFTLSTLGFASRAKAVKNKPHVNEVMSDGTLLKKYARQLEKLQAELKAAKERNACHELEAVESKLEEQERLNSELQQRINVLMKTLIVAEPVPKPRFNRRRTWGGGQMAGGLLDLPKMKLVTIEEENTSLVLTNDDFNTPYEDFEVQLIEEEREKCIEMDILPDSETSHNYLVNSSFGSSILSNRASTASRNFSLCTQDVCKEVQTSTSLTSTPVRHLATNTPSDLCANALYWHKEYNELRSFKGHEHEFSLELENQLVLKEKELEGLQKSLNEKEEILKNTLSLQERLTMKLYESEQILKNEKEMYSGELEALHRNNKDLETEIQELKRQNEHNKDQISVFKGNLFKEVMGLNPNRANQITESSEPSEIINVLMKCIMEKQMEIISQLQSQQVVRSPPRRVEPVDSNILEEENSHLRAALKDFGDEGEKSSGFMEKLRNLEDQIRQDSLQRMELQQQIAKLENERAENTVTLEKALEEKCILERKLEEQSRIITDIEEAKSALEENVWVFKTELEEKNKMLLQVETLNCKSASSFHCNKFVQTDVDEKECESTMEETLQAENQNVSGHKHRMNLGLKGFGDEDEKSSGFMEKIQKLEDQIRQDSLQKIQLQQQIEKLENERAECAMYLQKVLQGKDAVESQIEEQNVIIQENEKSNGSLEMSICSPESEKMEFLIEEQQHRNVDSSPAGHKDMLVTCIQSDASIINSENTTMKKLSTAICGIQEKKSFIFMEKLNNLEEKSKQASGQNKKLQYQITMTENENLENPMTPEKALVDICSLEGKIEQQRLLIKEREENIFILQQHISSLEAELKDKSDTQLVFQEQICELKNQLLSAKSFSSFKVSECTKDLEMKLNIEYKCKREREQELSHLEKRVIQQDEHLCTFAANAKVLEDQLKLVELQKEEMQNKIEKLEKNILECDVHLQNVLRDKISLEAKVEQHNKVIKEAEEWKSTMLLNINNLESELGEKKNMLLELQEHTNELEKHSKNLETWKIKLETLESINMGLEDNLRSELEYRSRQEKLIAQSRNELIELKQKLSESAENVKVLEEELKQEVSNNKDMKSLINELEKSKLEYQMKFKRAVEDKQALEAKVNDLIDDFEKSKISYQLCLNKLEEKLNGQKSVILGLEKQKSEFEGQHAILESKIENLEKEKYEVKKELNEKDGKFKELSQEAKDLEVQLKKELELKKELQNQLTLLVKLKSNYEEKLNLEIEQRENMTLKLTELTRKCTQQERRIKELENNKASLEEQLHDIENCQAKEEIKILKIQHDEEAVIRENMKKDLMSKEDELVQCKKRIQELENKIESLEFCDRVHDKSYNSRLQELETERKKLVENSEQQSMLESKLKHEVQCLQELLSKQEEKLKKVQEELQMSTDKIKNYCIAKKEMEDWIHSLEAEKKTYESILKKENEERKQLLFKVSDLNKRMAKHDETVKELSQAKVKMAEMMQSLESRASWNGKENSKEMELKELADLRKLCQEYELKTKRLTNERDSLVEITNLKHVECGCEQTPREMRHDVQVISESTFDKKQLESKNAELEKTVEYLRETLRREGYHYSSPHWVRKGDWAISNRKMKHLEKRVQELQEEVECLKGKNGGSPDELLDDTLFGQCLKSPPKPVCLKCEDLKKQVANFQEESAKWYMQIADLTRKLESEKMENKKITENLQQKLSSCIHENMRLRQEYRTFEAEVRRQAMKRHQETQTDPVHVPWDMIRAQGAGSKIADDYIIQKQKDLISKLQKDKELLKEAARKYKRRCEEMEAGQVAASSTVHMTRRAPSPAEVTPRRRLAMERIAREANERFAEQQRLQHSSNRQSEVTPRRRLAMERIAREANEMFAEQQRLQHSSNRQSEVTPRRRLAMERIAREANEMYAEQQRLQHSSNHQSNKENSCNQPE